VDTQTLGALAAEFMEQVEENYGEDAEVDEAIILATVRVTDDEGIVRQNMSVRCTNESPVVQAGLVAWGKDTVMGDWDDDGKL
jgi:hypothetical protein